MTEPAAKRRIGSRERALLILLAIVGALAIVFLLLVSGGDEDVEEANGGAPRPRPTSTATTPPAGEEEPPEVDEDFEARDPFEPLVVAPETGGDGGVPADGGVPGGEETRVPTEDGTGERRRVTLLDIFRDDGERFATVDVDGEEITVAEGETFADNFRLLDLTSKCGTFVFGDERFTLCLGQEVLK